MKGQYENEGYKVLSSSFRANQKVFNWLDAGIHTQISYTDRDAVNIRLDRLMQRAPFGDLYNEDGTPTINPIPIDPDQVNLLLNNQDGVYKNNSKGINLYVQPYLRINPIKGLTFETRLSANFSWTRNGTYEGLNSYQIFSNNASADRVNPYSPTNYQFTQASITNSDNIGYQWENILTYNFDINNDHEFTITGVTTWNSKQYNTSSMTNHGFNSNAYYWTNIGQPGVTTDNRPSMSSNYTMQKGMGIVGRINYSYLGRYMASVSVRHDGSSVLASGYRWSTFPAASIGWRFSEESFMEGTRDWLNNAKLRIGYGETGAAGLSPYSSWSIMGTGQSAVGNQITNISWYPNPLTNATLTWERSKSWNFGIDFSALNYRIDASLEYYLTNTSGVIWQRSLPITNGGDTTPGSIGGSLNINDNIASTRNQGIELTINTKNIVTKDFKWNSTLTLTRNWEKVTSLGEGASEYITNGDYTLKVGSPVRSYYAYQLDGIWQKGQEKDAAVFGLVPGEQRVAVPGLEHVSEGVYRKWIPAAPGETEGRYETYDANNQYVIDDNDRVIIGHNTPDWTIGFNNQFQYKWFDLSIYMMYRGGQMINYDMMTQYSNAGGTFPAYFDYWTENNPSNDFPMLNSNYDFMKDHKWGGSLAYQNGSFFKIKNITLGWTLSQAGCQKLHLQNLRVYGTITNPLVVATNHMLKDYDPEMNGSIRNPLTRQLVFGVNLTF